jgi:putative aldouronate transport system substrate-binding protein
MKKKVSRREMLRITAMGAAGTIVLAACAPKETPQAPTSAPAATDVPAKVEAKATSVPPTAAPTATEAPTALPPVELTWYLIGNGQPSGADEVMAALAELPQMKAINTKVNITIYGWGDFDQKMRLMMTGNEPWDMAFSSGWANSYTSGALNGNFAALDDLLPKYAPKTWASLPKAGWDLSRINGKIYAIPNQQIWYNPWGFLTRKELADKYGLDLTKVKTHADLTPYLEAIKQGEPQMGNKIVSDLLGVTGQTSGDMNGFQTVQGVPNGLMIKSGDKTRTIVDYYATPEFRKTYDLLHSWSVAGYLPKEASGYNDLPTQRQAGLFPVFLHVAKPGNDAELGTSAGGEWVMKALNENLYLGGVTSTLTAVNVSSKNADRAMMFLELMNTDPEVFNLVAKGLEGKSWVWVDKEKKVIGFPQGVDASTSPYYINIDWELGNQFIAYYTDPKQVGAWEATAAGNQAAAYPMAGPFVFDPTPVQAEVAAVQTIDTTFADMLNLGAPDPEDKDKGIAAYIAARKASGLDKIIAETQTQLTAFMAKYPELYP